MMINTIVRAIPIFLFFIKEPNTIPSNIIFPKSVSNKFKNKLGIPYNIAHNTANMEMEPINKLKLILEKYLSIFNAIYNINII